MTQLTFKKGLLLSLLSCLGAIAGLALLEVGLRAFDFDYPPGDDPIAIWNKLEDRDLRLGKGLHRVAARQLWEPRPGAPIPSAWSPDGERVNAAGYRGPQCAAEKSAGVLRIATLGDSSTFGYGVPYAQTYSAQLEAQLNAAGVSAQVLDFGVVGFTLLQGIERYRARVRDYHPDLVIAAFGAINDHFMAQGLCDVQKISQSKASESALGVLAQRARAKLRVLQLVARGLDSLHVEDAATREEIERRDVAFEEIRPHVGELDFETKYHGVRRVSPAEFEAGLAEFRRLVEADGATLVLLSMPRRRGVDMNLSILRKYSQVILDFAKASATLCVDGRGDFRNYFELEHGDPHLFFLPNDDVHPSVRGHARLAQRLCETIVQWKAAH